MKEKITVEYERFRDFNGMPTCAANFQTGEVCQFYRTQRMGCHETCLFVPDRDANFKGILPRLKRRKDGIGTLIPASWCPLFTKGELG